MTTEIIKINLNNIDLTRKRLKRYKRDVLTITSVHRTPDRMFEYAKKA